MKKIIIGKIVNVVGLKGEVKVYNYSDSEAVYCNTEQIFVEDTPRKIEGLRIQKNLLVIKFEGINDRNDAERQKGKSIYIDETQLEELPEGQFYIKDLIGMEVFSKKDGSLGIINNIIQNSAQDIIEVKMEDGKMLLIPMVDEFLVNIDDEKRMIEVKLIEGMLDL